MTPRELAICTGARIDRAEEWLPYIEDAMVEFAIDTPLRQAAFLSQIGHESGGLHWSSEIWGPTSAQLRYEGRKDLGNTEPGDGFRFKGRGLIQTTGRANYEATGDALGVDLISDPVQLAQPELAARSAAWFWSDRGLNELSDTEDFRRITVRINGGTNGLDERKRLYEQAKGVLCV
jgi:putative chitinase